MNEAEDRVGVDGLAEPVEPFRTPRWFVAVIVLAVLGCCIGFGVFVAIR